MITLKVKTSDVTQSFEIGQAEAILRLPNSQWELVSNKYRFDGNAIVKTRNRGKNLDARGKGSDKSGGTSPEQN